MTKVTEIIHLPVTFNGCGLYDNLGDPVGVLENDVNPEPISRAINENEDLRALLKDCRDFIAKDVNAGPCGLGLVVMVDEALENEN